MVKEILGKLINLNVFFFLRSNNVFEKLSQIFTANFTVKKTRCLAIFVC